MTVILPPSEIRLIVEKLAAYVVKNGRSFEDKILEKERHNPKFSFLYPNDPYNAYYQKRLEEYEFVGPEYADELLAQNRGAEQKKLEMAKPTTEGAAVDETEKKETQQTMSIKEYPPLDFGVIKLPAVSGLDYDVMKLTAQYVARNGRPFMQRLCEREARNPQFDFLKVGHTLHSVFLQLVEQYGKVLLPSRTLLNRLQIFVHRRAEVIDRIMQRAEYTKCIKKQQMEEERSAEKERLAFASIDWSDFVVQATVDFGVNDRQMDLPRPLDYATIRSMSIVQRRELWSGNVAMNGAGQNRVVIASKQSDDEAAMEVEDISLAPNNLPAAKRFVEPVVPPSFINSPPPIVIATTKSGVQVRSDYVPKASQNSSTNATAESNEQCPICGQWIPKSQTAEHIRVESLDPKWKEQRARYEAKHGVTNTIVSGYDVSQNLRNLKEARSHLTTLGQKEIEQTIQQAGQMIASQVTQWDGRTDTSSIRQVTQDAIRKLKRHQHK